MGSAQDSPSWASMWHKVLPKQNCKPSPACEQPDLMPSFGGRMVGPGVLSQLKLLELNVIETERRQGTRCCWIFIEMKDKE